MSVHSHKFAISAFHHGIELKSIGEHPQVSSLITGIFNQRPPQPRYNFIWDAHLVIDYFKKDLSDNKKLTDQHINFQFFQITLSVCAP